MKSTVSGVFEDLQFKISEGYRQNWSFFVVLAVSVYFKYQWNFRPHPTKFGETPLYTLVYCLSTESIKKYLFWPWNYEINTFKSQILKSRVTLRLIGQKGHASFCVLTNVSIKWAVSFLTNQTYHSSTLAKCETFSLLPRRPNIPTTKKVQDSFEFLRHLEYITLS